MRGRQPEDHTGRIYGHWTVIRRAAPTYPSTPGIAVEWLCRCSACGNDQWIIPGQFKYPEKGVARCVGCAQIKEEEAEAAVLARRADWLEQKRLLEERRAKAMAGEEILDSRWETICKAAADRGIAMTVTRAEALRAFHDQDRKCALTGTPLTLAASRKYIGTASLDRIDGARPYEAGNVQWIHKHVNMMKCTFGQEYFMALCQAVATGTPLPDELMEGKVEGPNPFFRFRTRAQSVGPANDNEEEAPAISGKPGLAG